mgnify:CR=1 FL=1
MITVLSCQWYTHRSAEDTVFEGAKGSAWTTGASDLLRASKTGDSWKKQASLVFCIKHKNKNKTMFIL